MVLLTRSCLPIAALCAAAAAATAGAQTSRSDPTDVQSRLGIGVQFDLPNRWEADLRYRVRRVDNVSQYRGSYVTAEVSHRPLRPLTVLASYRVAFVDNATYHRYALGSEVKRDFGETELGVRAVVQYQKQNFSNNDEQSSDTDAFLRPRLSVKQALAERLDAYASTEPYLKTGGLAVDNWRNTFGVRVEYLPGKKFDLYYIYRPDYGKRTYNRTFHIIGFDLDFDVKIRG